MMKRLAALSLLVTLVLGTVGCQKAPDSVGDAADKPAAVTAAVSDGAPTPLADTEWRLHGLDVGEQRYSPLDQINRENVSELGLAWFFDLYTRRGVEATPLMVDGTLYVSGSWSMVYALDARTGELKWFKDPQVDRSFLAKGC